MIVVIPARFGSERLPGKPMADVGGQPMIQRVHAVAAGSGASRVIIATDDERIRACARHFGAEVCMTSIACASGTDRIAETIDQLGIDDREIVVNLQGDEPLMPPALIRRTSEALARQPEFAMATPCCAIRDRRTFFDPSVVKVVCDERGRALYFSRAPIPWPRESERLGDKTQAPRHAFRHIGLYAYRADFVRRFTAMTPAPMEGAESLEQLRALWHGEAILVIETEDAPPPGVDTAEDLRRVQEIFGAVEDRSKGGG